MTDDPVVKVARDLTAIEQMISRLLTQAVHNGDHPMMPGGPAMVALGNVANLEAWENQQETTERIGRVYTMADCEDPDDAWPPFQLVEFWTEAWRRENGHEYGKRPTIQSEVAYLRAMLEWAWDNEAGWDDMARDVNRARVKLEGILFDGERSERGVPCMYDECRGVRLVRKMVPARDKDGEKTWRQTDWHCPRCHRQWDEDAYARMVTAASEAAKVEQIEGETWATTDYAARVTGIPHSTIRVWVHRRVLDTVCLLSGQRSGMVRIEQVRELRATRKRAS